MNENDAGLVIIVLIILIFLIGNTCILIDLIKKPKNIYKKNKSSHHSLQKNKIYESDDLIIKDI